MPEERTIELGQGRSLHAVTAGEGPDIVLVHGMFATSHDWLNGPFDRLVGEGHRVTAIDRPGYGLSRRPRFEGTPRAQAEQIREGLAAIGVERAMFVGHSYGSLVSLAYAELYPEQVSHLVLVGPICFPEPRLLEHTLLAPRSVPLFGPLFSSAAEATFDRPMLKIVQRLMFAPEPVRRDWEASFPYEQILDAEALVLEGEDAAAILPFSPTGLIDVGRIEAPTRILIGTQDMIVQQEGQGKQLARLMPQACLTELGGVGHMPHHVRPDAVVDAVKEAFAEA